MHRAYTSIIMQVDVELKLLKSFQKAIDYLLKEVKVRNLEKSLTLKERFIKADRRKHISSSFFYTHELPRMVISTCNTFVQVILQLIYPPILYQLQLSRRCCTSLENKDSSL